MRKKILYIFGGLYTPNGMASIISEKVNYLAENTDYEMYMVLTELLDKPEFYHLYPKVKRVNLNINFDELDRMPIFKKIVFYLFKQRKYRKQLTRCLTDIKPDITVSITRREINFLTKIKDGSKKVSEIHFARTFYRKIDKRYLPKWLNQWLSKLWMDSLIKNLKELDKFVVLTHEDMRNWPEIKNIMVIPNFVSNLSSKKTNCSQKRVIAVGRYSWQKGFDLLIDAWEIVYNRHPDWRLDIYGGGDNDQYQKMADAKHLSSVVYCYPAVQDVFEKYQESSIFVLSSRYEGFGIVLVEAMSVGLPAVAFACPCGPQDLIQDGYNGLLVENGNVEQLAEKISFLVENDDMRQSMSYNAAASVAYYTKENIMQYWIKLFDNL